MGCSVVLLKCQSWTVLLHEWQQFRCQHLITVVCGSEIALDDNQSGTTMETKWIPNHYAASTKSVIAFSRSTPHPYPAISKPKCETWLVTKDNVIPASLIPSNVSSGPFQTLTKVKWRENGSCVWSPSLQTSSSQSIPDGGWWHPTPEQVSACGRGHLAAVSKRLRRWRNLVCLSSQRDVTSGCPGLGRSATAPVCCTRVLRLWIVCRLHPSVRATAEMACPASSLPTARSRSAFVRRGIQSLICHQKF